ncbi:hypothetical protein BDV96DRAFT_595344 [Lophiotrema nucula]|uniref:Rhodopsin domain-containing protein n=1 Tax=Lophiotrema nucula TaxID=690887 RepID=A0A6A5ZMV9_9PLEO|nr:hypothetical protein BDV96DRAFT_595344 [Lophiotrema nucula]
MRDYMKLFSTVRTVKIASIVGMVMAFMAYFPASLVLSYYDAPHVGQSWDELVTNGMTQKGVPGGITIGVASVIVDIYIFVLPLPTLARLNMPLAKRIQVMTLFATAFLGVAASVACIAYRIKLIWPTDATWQAGVVAIPIIIENNVAIIVGSLPSFASFMRNPDSKDNSQQQKDNRATLESYITVPSETHIVADTSYQGIVRTVGFTHQENNTGSLDSLV